VSTGDGEALTPEQVEILRTPDWPTYLGHLICPLCWCSVHPEVRSAHESWHLRSTP
jgi:hypothetical protein